jgi:hypothetical protein
MALPAEPVPALEQRASLQVLCDDVGALWISLGPDYIPEELPSFDALDSDSEEFTFLAKLLEVCQYPL